VRHDKSVSSGRLSTFAGSVIVIAGAWHLLQGVATLVNDGRYVGPPNYIYKFELTGWGWIYLVIGVFAVPVGAAVFTGQLWGRVVAILLAGVSVVVNFMFIPWYPLWSVLMIGLDIAVVWALVLYQHRWR
jgi:hypothetical protein